MDRELELDLFDKINRLNETMIKELRKERLEYLQTINELKLQNESILHQNTKYESEIGNLKIDLQNLKDKFQNYFEADRKFKWKTTLSRYCKFNLESTTITVSKDERKILDKCNRAAMEYKESDSLSSKYIIANAVKSNKSELWEKFFIIVFNQTANDALKEDKVDDDYENDDWV